ncbi:MAG: type II secretion system F family protein [Lachnospiraceae bacterium]|nr:type II secretion system F family protein [Lachnospiraceae bacterium]
MTIIKIVLLTIAAALIAMYIVLNLRGQKYDSLLNGLPKEGFSDKAFFAAGYALQDIKPFSMTGRIGKKLLSQSKILYPENEGRYAEYWARLYWARTLGLSVLVITFVFIITPLLDGMYMLLALFFGIASVYAIYTQGAKDMENKLKERAEKCLLEFPNVVSKLALLMNCGLIMKDAWFQVAKDKEGDIYDLMREACSEMNSGKSAAEAIYNFGVYSYSPEIRKFSSIIIQNVEKGGSDVTMYMRQQSSELWAHKRQLMLQRGDAAAAKLLIPTMIVLVGVLAIIISAAMGNISML